MANHHKLSPVSTDKILDNMEQPLKKFWVCDIESRNWVDFVTIGLTDGHCWFHFEDLAKFFEYLCIDCTDKTLFAHFGGKFDFMFLLDHLLTKSNAIVDGIIPRGSGILCFDVIFDALITSKEGEPFTYTGGTKLTFRDSSALLPFGLKALTHNFHVETKKGEWDHSKTTGATPELLEYCKADCFGLHQVIEKYFNWPIIKQAGPAFTIAGQAMKVLKTILEVEIHSLNDHIDGFVRAAYFGGRTEIFKPLFVGPGKLYCGDVNSLYPTVMRDLEYPSKFKKFDYKYRPEQIGFYDAEVEVPKDMYVPPLGVVWEVDGQKKFIFPTGKFKGRWSTMELEYAKSIGVKILSTGEGVLFESGGKFFKRYVETLYEIREKSERDSVDSVLAKLLLNSCYGRTGIRRDREGVVVDRGQCGIIDFCEIPTASGVKIRLAKEPKVIDTFSNVAIAAWVTSAARIHMHKLYMKNPEALYYTDTDSLFTTDKVTDSKKLGDIKCEYTCKGVCFLLPKSYVVEGIEGMKETTKKVTMKGFDKKKTSHFTVDDFMCALEGDLRRLRVKQESRFATFKTALRKNKILTMLPSGMREIRAMYDKRLIFKKTDGTYDTKPHFIVDNEAIVTDLPGRKKKRKLLAELEALQIKAMAGWTEKTAKKIQKLQDEIDELP